MAMTKEVMGLLLRFNATYRNVAKVSLRALSTKPMPSPKDEPKDIIINYLDGKDNGIAVLGMNRPDSRNAFGKHFAAQFYEAVSNLRENSKLRVLIIRSLVPKIFSAGGDLRERLTLAEAEVGPFVNSLRTLMTSVEKLPAPVISAIDGPALGGGLELALACDIRTASSDAKLGLVETRLAIIPGAGGTQRLPRIVGIAKAKELIYTARIVDGEEAQQIGLVNQVVPQNKNGDAAYQAALSVAREILPNGPIGIKSAKTAISNGYEVPIEEGLEIEKTCYSKVIHTQDRIEGLTAFATKRAPVYRGC